MPLQDALFFSSHRDDSMTLSLLLSHGHWLSHIDLTKRTSPLHGMYEAGEVGIFCDVANGQTVGSRLATQDFGYMLTI
jgi:hypothetical protein